MSVYRETRLGAPMGAGAMLIIAEDTCMVEMTRFFLNFLSTESCGKCVPCREGIGQMLEIVNDITQGRGSEGDIELLEEIARVAGAAALCALGRTASDPLFSSLRYFRKEWEAHIREKKCPAGACKKLSPQQELSQRE